MWNRPGRIIVFHLLLISSRCTMEIVNPILARALDLLQRGNYELAEQQYYRAATASLENFGENDIVTARTLAHLARLRASHGKSDEALPMYERIVRIHEGLPVPSNTDHAVALMELATLREEGKSEDAEDLRRKADHILAELNARMHTTTATSDESCEGEESSECSSSGEICGGSAGSDDGAESSEFGDDTDKGGGFEIGE